MNKDIEKLLQDRYFLKEENSWEDIAKRVSEIYPPIYNDILDMNFIPSSPTLMNANTKGERYGTLSSCFPMGIEDSLENIMDAYKEAGITTKMGGGIGYDFSALRSSQELVKSLNRYSSGPLPYINMFNSLLEGIQQGGARRGAGGAQLSITHPQSRDFTLAKNEEGLFDRFNFTLRMPNSFYTQLEKNPDEIFYTKFISGEDVPLKNDSGKEMTIKQVWDLIIEQAWTNGEPGIFNEDIAYERCTVTNLSNHVLTNPCNEYVNIAYTACALGSINVSNYIVGNNFDWEKFEHIIESATLFINNTLDQNKYPIKKIKDTNLKVRPIGIGFMGIAHLLFKLRIPYNSEKAKTLIKNICRYTTLKSMQVSVELAKEIGESYPVFDYDLFMKANKRFFTSKFCKNIDIEKLCQDIKKYGIRNSCFTSIAPTGTISFINNCSSGIEPVFALCYTRSIEVNNHEYEDVFICDPVFEDYLNENFDEPTKEKILKQVANNDGSCQKCEDISEEMKKVFIIAEELTPVEHLDILEVTANNVSLSVSKTINLPTQATKQDISDIYISAHKRGIIGVTVYRKGSRKKEILKHKEGVIIERNAPKRPKSLPCHVYKITVHGEEWRVFVGLYKNHPYEVFSGKVNLVDFPSNISEGNLIKIKSGLYQFECNEEVLIKDISAIFESGAQEALTRQISTNLRHGTPIDFIIEQLQKSHGTIADYNKSIIRALKRYMKEKESKNICPSCQNILVYKEGCETCIRCGWAKC